MSQNKIDYVFSIGANTEEFEKKVSQTLDLISKSDKNTIKLGVNDKALSESIRTSLNDILLSMKNGKGVDLSKMVDVKGFAEKLSGTAPMITSLRDSVKLLGDDFKSLSGFEIGNDLAGTLQNLNSTVEKLNTNLEKYGNSIGDITKRLSDLENTTNTFSGVSDSLSNVGNESVESSQKIEKSQVGIQEEIKKTIAQYDTLEDKLAYVKDLQKADKSVYPLEQKLSNLDDNGNYGKVFDETEEKLGSAKEKLKQFSDQYDSLVIKYKDGSEVDYSGYDANSLNLEDAKLNKKLIEDIILVKNELSGDVNPLISDKSLNLDKVQVAEDTILQIKKTLLDGLGDGIDLSKFSSVFEEIKNGALTANEAVEKISEQIKEQVDISSLSSKTKSDTSNQNSTIAANEELIKSEIEVINAKEASNLVKVDSTSAVADKSNAIDTADVIDNTVDALKEEASVIDNITNKEVSFLKEKKDAVDDVTDSIIKLGKVEESASKSVDTKDIEKSVKKPTQHAISTSDYNETSDTLKGLGVENLKTKYSEITDVGIKQLSTGVVKFSANVKTAQGDWQKFTAAITKDGEFVQESTLDLGAKKADALNKELEYALNGGAKSGVKEKIYDATQVKEFAKEVSASMQTVLDQSKKYKVAVDAFGQVSISESIVKDGKNIDTFVAKFDDVSEVLEKSKGDVAEFKKYFNDAFRDSSYTVGIDETKDNKGTVSKDLEKENNKIKEQEDLMNSLSASYVEASGKVAKFSSASGKTSKYKTAISELVAKMKEWNVLNTKVSSGTATDLEIKKVKELNIEVNKLVKEYGTDLYNAKNKQGTIYVENVSEEDAVSELRSLAEATNKQEIETYKLDSANKKLTVSYKQVDGLIGKEVFSYDKLNKAIRVNTQETVSNATGMSKLKSTAAEALKVIMASFTMYNVSFAIFNQFKSGFNVLKEYDTALTNISYTMNLTSSALQSMGESAIQMADDMSISISNAMDIYKIYANMQTTEAEISATAVPTAILANLESGTTETASDQIQGIIQQFNMDAVDDSMHVVDVLDKISANVAIDNAKAIDVMTASITASGQAAYDAGLTYEQLAAISAKIAESTREDGSSIGNSLKTIITRLSSASNLSGSEDVDNETLSKASKSLADIGIAVYNVDGSFRELDVIMTELRGKWDGLTDAQQSNISFSVECSRCA